MDYDPKVQKTELIASAKYVAVCFGGKDDLTKAGDERWALHYKLLAVAEASDKNSDAAAESVGRTITDKLIDKKGSSFWGGKWDMFLPAMFPKAKEKGSQIEVHAHLCIGRLIILRIGEGNGNPEFNEPEKINRVYGFETFTDDKSQFEEAIKEALPEGSRPSSPPVNEEFDNQF